MGPFDVAHADRAVCVQLDLGALAPGAPFSDPFEKCDLYAWSGSVP